MKYAGAKLKLKAILSMLVLSGCTNYPIPVYFIDTDLQEVREHSIVDRANIIISEQPIAIHPLEKANGLICTTPETFRRMKEDYLNNLKPVVFDLVYEQKALSSRQPSSPLNPQHF